MFKDGFQYGRGRDNIHEIMGESKWSYFRKPFVKSYFVRSHLTANNLAITEADSYQCTSAT